MRRPGGAARSGTAPRSCAPLLLLLALALALPAPPRAAAAAAETVQQPNYQIYKRK